MSVAKTKISIEMFGDLAVFRHVNQHFLMRMRCSCSSHFGMHHQWCKDLRCKLAPFLTKVLLHLSYMLVKTTSKINNTDIRSKFKFTPHLSTELPSYLSSGAQQVSNKSSVA